MLPDGGRFMDEPQGVWHRDVWDIQLCQDVAPGKRLLLSTAAR